MIVDQIEFCNFIVLNKCDLLSEEQKQAYLAENPEVRENWDSRYGDRENQVVFIGKGYNKDSIRMELEKCLD